MRLWRHIGSRRQSQFALLLVLMLLASVSEIISIGAVLPFLGVLLDPERVLNQPFMEPVIGFFGITSAEQITLFLTLAFCASAVISGGVRLLLLYLGTRLSYATGADLGYSIYRRTLYQPYEVHCSRNSSEVIDGITGKVNNVIVGINYFVTIVSSSIILVAIVGTLLKFYPAMTLMAFSGFFLIYLAVIKINNKKLDNNSKVLARESTQVLKALQEGLGGIRDVLIDGTQNEYCQVYRKADLQLRRAQGVNLFISASPRYAIEALGICLIAAIAYYLTHGPGGISSVMPVLGALALAAQRLLPLLQQLYSSWVGVKNIKYSLLDALDLLDQPLPSHASHSFKSAMKYDTSVVLSNLGFRYGSDGPLVLKQIDLEIQKGSRVGFIGETGSGKSTLLDIVMGLLRPTEGRLLIDGQPVTADNQPAWQQHIAHVPQAIFLADTSISENIALGVPREQIDQARVKQAAQRAQIAETIERMPRKYQTQVGERGVRLSGGQRQRIGIARALYKNADVIVFDEATSALDDQTELAVMQTIESLGRDLTILIIAHRLTTLKGCTKVVELSEGRVRRVGSYSEIVEKTNKN